MAARSLENFLVRELATVKDAIELIQKNESRCVIVVNGQRKAIGVFSEGDVLRAILDGVDMHAPLRTLIKPSFRYLHSRDILAARRLFLRGITLLPILDHEFVVQDVLTLNDVFQNELD